MKQRTINILEAADCALRGYAYFELERLGEMELSEEMDRTHRQSCTEYRCLYLCLAAAACEAGDLWV